MRTDKFIKYNGSKSTLEEILTEISNSSSEKGFHLEEYSESIYYLKPVVEFGGLEFNNRNVDSINIKVKINSISETNHIIRMTTKIRTLNYILGLLFVAVSIGGWMSDMPWQGALSVPFIIILCMFWFNFITGSQEKATVLDFKDEIKKKLLIRDPAFQQKLRRSRARRRR